MHAPEGPSGPAAAGFPAAPARWLAIGSGTAEALEAHWARQADAPGCTKARILQVRNVHDALSALHEGPVAACVISAGVIEARPGDALRVLREQLGAAPLLMLEGEEGTEARDKARTMGVPLWGATRSAPPSESAQQVPLPPPSSSLRVPETNELRPLPRADAEAGRTKPIAPDDFAEGCLERIGRLGSLVEYVLEALSDASNANRISLMLSEQEGRMLRLRAGRGIHESLLGSVRCTVGSGIAGRVAALGRAAAGHGSEGGPRGYGGSAYVVLPLGKGRRCEGVVSLTGLPGNALPDAGALQAWSALGRRAGLALWSARRLQRARSRSNRDTLTGLPNRRAFEGALKRELERARRAGGGLAVGLFDVDHFKGVNDRYGHPAGDQVLVEVARRLETAFRETDLVARWGGEEFVVLLPCQTPEEAQEAHIVLDRARLGIAARPFALGEGLAPIPLTISGGLASFPGSGTSPATLVESADKALYEAKHSGRNRIVSI